MSKTNRACDSYDDAFRAAVFNQPWADAPWRIMTEQAVHEEMAYYAGPWFD